jgi:hypothetical protein
MHYLSYSGGMLYLLSFVPLGCNEGICPSGRVAFAYILVSLDKRNQLVLFWFAMRQKAYITIRYLMNLALQKQLLKQTGSSYYQIDFKP